MKQLSKSDEEFLTNESLRLYREYIEPNMDELLKADGWIFRGFTAEERKAFEEKYGIVKPGSRLPRPTTQPPQS